VIFIATIVLSVLFILSAIIRMAILKWLNSQLYTNGKNFPVFLIKKNVIL
jgi:hypothetical protein